MRLNDACCTTLTMPPFPGRLVRYLTRQRAPKVGLRVSLAEARKLREAMVTAPLWPTTAVPWSLKHHQHLPLEKRQVHRHRRRNRMHPATSRVPTFMPSWIDSLPARVAPQPSRPSTSSQRIPPPPPLPPSRCRRHHHLPSTLRSTPARLRRRLKRNEKMVRRRHGKRLSTARWDAEGFSLPSNQFPSPKMPSIRNLQVARSIASGEVASSECPICFSVPPESPTLVACGHIFCRECLLECIRGSVGNGAASTEESSLSERSSSMIPGAPVVRKGKGGRMHMLSAFFRASSAGEGSVSGDADGDARDEVGDGACPMCQDPVVLADCLAISDDGPCTAFPERAATSAAVSTASDSAADGTHADGGEGSGLVHSPSLWLGKTRVSDGAVEIKKNHKPLWASPSETPKPTATPEIPGLKQLPSWRTSCKLSWLQRHLEELHAAEPSTKVRSKWLEAVTLFYLSQPNLHGAFVIARSLCSASGRQCLIWCSGCSTVLTQAAIADFQAFDSTEV